MNIQDNYERRINNVCNVENSDRRSKHTSSFIFGFIESHPPVELSIHRNTMLEKEMGCGCVCVYVCCNGNEGQGGKVCVCVGGEGEGEWERTTTSNYYTLSANTSLAQKLRKGI